MHFVIMGCGRVGATLASTLDDQGHSVAIIDADPDAFRRLPDDFSGRRITGMGMDRDALRQAGLKEAYAFAAVSSGDNSNIISARIAREVFGVKRVVARIHDTKRALVYQRLGIPTVPTVERTAESIMHWLMPPDADVLWTSPMGDAVLVRAAPTAQWFGVSCSLVEELTSSRLTFIYRGGMTIIAESDLVVQENDVLIFASSIDPVKLRAILTSAPQLES